MVRAVSLLFAVPLLTLSCLSAAQVVPATGYVASEYFTYSWPNMNRPDQVAIAPGGAFGNDIYFVDQSNVGSGRLYRLQDLNGDGDALDPGEGTPLYQFPISTHAGLSTSPQRPQGLTFGNGGGFGSSLFMVDDGPDRVFKVTAPDAQNTSVNNFAAGFFTPIGAAMKPDASGMLVTDANALFPAPTFATADGRIDFVDSSGNRVPSWANGSNIPTGLWDPWFPCMMSNGWVAVTNINISDGSSFNRELLAFKDLNNDGDANDAGEVRVMLPQSMTSAIGLTLRGVIACGTDGTLYSGTSTAGRRLIALRDVNDDGDFWDAGTNDFDVGEMTVVATDMPFATGLAVAPNGNIFVGFLDNGLGKIWRIASSQMAQASSIPTLSAWGLIILSSLLAMGTILSLRRKRQ